MKKFYSILLTICLVATTLMGCATTKTVEPAVAVEETTDNVFNVVTTIFPLYDWTVNVLGDTEGVEVSWLIDNGVDVHSYQPSTDDIIQIAQCDLFIYVGGESDQWVDDALANALNPDMVVVNLMEILGDDAKAEEVVEGMEAHVHDHEEEEEADHVHEEEEADHVHEEEEADHVHDEEEADHVHDEEEVDHVHEEEEVDHVHEEEEADHVHEEEQADHIHDEEEVDHVHDEVELDEHVWLSLKNAQVLTEAISVGLSTMNPDLAEDYAANTAAYVAELVQLDQAYGEVVGAGTYSTLLFGDRFPFRYLVDDYNLTYYAAFAGCSAETEASFETITFLATQLDILDLPIIITIDGDAGKIAQTVVDSTTDKDQTILVMNSMQSTAVADMEAGATYLNIMEANLAVLEKALG